MNIIDQYFLYKKKIGLFCPHSVGVLRVDRAAGSCQQGLPGL
jgi:hypothetical protein